MGSRRRFFRRDDAVTEVIGYVLSFALSAIFLLIALNVFHAARGNTEHVVTGVELKTIADRVASHIVEMGFVSQEFPNARMSVALDIPQSFSGRTYTITAAADTVEVATDDGLLTASAGTYKTEILEYISVGGVVGSSNERLVIAYEQLAGPVRSITISGE